MRQLGLGLLLGLVFGSVGMALASPPACQIGGLRDPQGDHYETGWTVLLQGNEVCTDPYVRPGEREIECRSPRPR
jgi:hypothetical protein